MTKIDHVLLKQLARMATHGFDSYAEEARSFEWDLNILIIGTMEAGLHTLSMEADKDLLDIDTYLAKPNANFERISDERVEILSMYSEQTRFLRNSALVSLTSRLFQALRRMATSAQFRPRSPGVYKGQFSTKKGEFSRLWNELEARFHLDLVKNSELIEFVEPMVMARNQIVHEGGVVNQLKKDMTIDTAFAVAYPDYVYGTGMFAEVEAKEEVLKQNFEASVKLVKWLATQLRQMELASLEAEDDLK